MELRVEVGSKFGKLVNAYQLDPGSKLKWIVGGRGGGLIYIGEFIRVGTNL